MLTINGAFRPQRVSGQQRYATEIARHLLSTDGVDEIGVPGVLAARASSTWLWVQTALPVAARRRVLLSLTSRAPALARRHVVTVHDLFPITHPEWYSSRYVAVHRPLLEYHLRNVPLLVAVSEPVANEIRDWSSGRSDPIVAPNAPSSVFGRPAVAGSVRSPFERVGRTDILDAAGYFFAVGSTDPRKNFRRLITAHAALSTRQRVRYPLVLAGGNFKHFRDVEFEDGKDVVRLGYVSDEELAALYRHAHAVVFPSLDEGFGLPTVEAAAAGARLLVSDIPVFRWICGENADYFDPQDVGSINAVLAAAADTSREPQHGEFATQVFARFDWKRSATNILTAVRERFDAP